tara:strand:- start:3074 stop:3493 length:420 start_codon:yes stop_codon:yes gene_type:complete
MSIPNTTTFTLQNVVDEIGPTTDDLVDCFADAISAAFDPAYAGSKDELLNFRNYGSPNLIAVNRSAIGYSTGALACGVSRVLTMFHDGAVFVPQVGDTIYNGNIPYTLFSGNNLWWAIANANTAILIGTDGVVDSVHTC